MPSIDTNRGWGTYAWSQRGDEWSADWGDAETHWYATIFPRIRRFLPAKRVLEIAPGYGRWTQFLIDCADNYTGVDLNAECITACNARFEAASNAVFIENDGKSLTGVTDGSIDFAFSFDSLVHAEIDVIECYLRELARTLSHDGVAFLHHSNLGEYGGAALSLSGFLLEPALKSPFARRVLRRLQLLDWSHWRAPSVTAAKVAEKAEKNGLICIGQEIITWGPRNFRAIDCLSVLARPRSRWERPNVVVRNPYFMIEARSAQIISVIYTSLSKRM